MTKVCQSCGYLNSEKDNICRFCGEKIIKKMDRPKAKKNKIKDIPTSTSSSTDSNRRPNTRTTKTKRTYEPYSTIPKRKRRDEFLETNSRKESRRPPKEDISEYPQDYYHRNYYPHLSYPYVDPYSYPNPYYYYTPKLESKSDISQILAALVILPSFIFFAIILTINFISLLIGLTIVVPNTFSVDASLILIYPWPNFVYSISISGIYLTAWYLFIISAIIVSVIWLIKTDGIEFMKILHKSVKNFQPPPLRSENSFIIIAQIFFIILFIHLAITIIIIFFGINISTPDINENFALWEPLYYLANASVAEEIFSRILYIGLPLLAFDYFYKKRTKKIHKYIVGGGFEIENITIFLIIFSSLLFGLAHYPSWGLWKVFPTFAAGIGFGYLFVRKGVHTAIVLHFLIDYMSIVLLLLGNNLGLIFFVAFSLGIIMLFWLSSGAIYSWLYFKKTFYYLFNRISDAPGRPTYITTASTPTNDSYIDSGALPPPPRDYYDHDYNRDYYNQHKYDQETPRRSQAPVDEYYQSYPYPPPPPPPPPPHQFDYNYEYDYNYNYGYGPQYYYSNPYPYPYPYPDQYYYDRRSYYDNSRRRNSMGPRVKDDHLKSRKQTDFSKKNKYRSTTNKDKNRLDLKPKPEHRTKVLVRNCPFCNNELKYFKSTKRYYCRHCLQYIN